MKYQLSKENIKSIGRGSLIAGGGAVATYLLTVLSTMDFGPNTPIVVAVCSMLINVIYQYQKA